MAGIALASYANTEPERLAGSRLAVTKGGHQGADQNKGVRDRGFADRRAVPPAPPTS